LPESVVKVVESFVPTLVTPVMMTTAIRAAIRPYSIAVAPDSFLIKSRSKPIGNPFFHCEQPRPTVLCQPAPPDFKESKLNEGTH